MKVLKYFLISTSVASLLACSGGAQQPSSGRDGNSANKSPKGSDLAEETDNKPEKPGQLSPTDPNLPKSNIEPLGTTSDNTRLPQVPAGEMPAPGNPSENPNKNPSPSPSPAPPPPSHKLTVDCNQALNIRFEFGGRVQPFRMTGGLINGQPTELVTAHCPKIKTALDQKGFPLAQKPASKPTGGDGFSARCTSTTLMLSYVTGNPDAGSGIALAQGVDIESSDICLEMRNIINGLLLKKGPLPVTLQ